MKVIVINGPNLNLLGTREPDLYGAMTMDQINERLAAMGAELGIKVSGYQSNHEGELVDAIQAAGSEGAGVILNAGAYTHTSVALRDAVLGSGATVVEVHLTNPQAREEFRQVSLLADVCAGSIAGFGWQSYVLAMKWFAAQGGE